MRSLLIHLYWKKGNTETFFPLTMRLDSICGVVLCDTGMKEPKSI